MTEHPHVLAPPSAFVTVLAWILIVLTGLSSLMLVFQNIMVHTLLADPEMRAVMTEMPQGVPGQPMLKFMMGHMRTIAAVSLVLCLMAFSCAIALLQRRNWGRQAIIGFLALGIVYQLLSLGFAWFMWRDMGATVGFDHAQFQELLHSMQLVSSFFTLATSALFAWLIYKLRSPAVRAEFVPLASWSA